MDSYFKIIDKEWKILINYIYILWPCKIPDLYFKQPTFCTKIHFKTFTIKIINTPTCFGLVRPSSGSCRA